MIRYKYQDSVEIQVSGPKNLLPAPILRSGRTNMTWVHFLNAVCGVPVDASGDYYVGSSTYSSNPVSGWAARLDDPIKNFIDRFTMKRKKYCVRLYKNDELAPKVKVNTTNTPESGNGSNNGNSWLPAGFKKTPTTYTVPVRKFAAAIPLTPETFATVTQLKTEKQDGVALLSTATANTSSGSSVQNREAPVRPGPPASPCSFRSKQQSPPQSSRTPALSVQQRVCLAVQQERAQRVTQLKSVALTSATAGSANLNKEPRPGTSSGVVVVTTTSTSIRTGPPSKSRWSPKDHPAFKRSHSPTFGEECNFKIVKVTGGVGESPIEPTAAAPEESSEIEVIDLEGEDERPREGNNQHHTLGGMEDDDPCPDDASFCTAASEEARDFRRSGIVPWDIKAAFERNVDNFDPVMLSHIKREYQKVKHTRGWGRNMKRAPRAFYFLSELFKD